MSTGNDFQIGNTQGSNTPGQPNFEPVLTPMNKVQKAETKISKVEKAKLAGKNLRGTIDEVLRDPEADHFEHDDLQLLKFHGTYQQDDRDLRKPRRAEGLGKAYSFMIRVALPGGVLTPKQYLDLDRMADKFANGTLRITTRQAIQFHGVIKSELRETMRQINESLVTTLAACGDVLRNVMATAPPFADEVHTTIRQTAVDIASELRPATKAYHEIWIDGQRTVSTLEDEPFYGPDYLPRKYKVGVTVMGDNQIDIYSYDAGLIGIVKDDKLIGFNVIAGGGLGMSHGRENTFAQIASEVGFVSVADGIAAIKNIASIYRDFGNRENRKQARLKYLINEKGLEWFQNEFRERADFDLKPWHPMPAIKINDWLGQHRQSETDNDQKWFYGIFVENGRVKDTPDMQMRSALRTIVEEVQPGVVLTAQQSLLFTDLSDEDLASVKRILVAHGVPLIEELSAARRYSMACPALPTCGMAVAESERVAPELISEIETVLESLGVRSEPLTIRMTGCPNGCARPYTADIALVGRRPGIYHLFIGGRLQGDRMADLYAADIKIEDTVATLRPLLTRWAEDRNESEGFGDFYQRLIGRSERRLRVTGKEQANFEDVQLQLVQLGVGK